MLVVVVVDWPSKDQDPHHLLEKDLRKKKELEKDKNSTRNPKPTYTEEPQKRAQGFVF